MSKTLLGIESLVRRVCEEIFGVKTELDPSLFGMQNSAPNDADYDGFPQVPTGEIALQLIQDKPDIVIPRPAANFHAYSIQVSKVPSRIAGANPSRRKMIIRNIGGATSAANDNVAIGDERVTFVDAFNVHGFVITNTYDNNSKPTSTVELETTHEVWAVVSGAATDPTCILTIIETSDEGGALVA